MTLLHEYLDFVEKHDDGHCIDVNQPVLNRQIEHCARLFALLIVCI